MRTLKLWLLRLLNKAVQLAPVGPDTKWAVLADIDKTIHEMERDGWKVEEITAIPEKGKITDRTAGSQNK